MQAYTKASQRESLYKLDRLTRKQQILSVMSETVPMTAREIAAALKYDHTDFVKPRISELLKAEEIKDIMRKFDPKTGVKVTAYIKL